MENEPDKPLFSEPQGSKISAFIVIGAGVGAAIGVATDNLAVGLAVAFCRSRTWIAACF